MSSPTLEPREGRVIADRYVLGSRIGRGGLGTVWRAQDRILDRTVAVKAMSLSALSDQNSYEYVQRLMREARAAARLNHPNVVTLYDVVMEGDRPWIVMEYVDGPSLQEIIDNQGPISPHRAAEIGLQVLDGLTAAHQGGILHRDVKPSNILFTDHGDAMLTDFGVALVEGDATLTQTGQIFGSPAYLPPERIKGDRATPASDLWGLGATLYAAVEGRAPHQRDNVIAALEATLFEPVPPPRRAAALTPVLEGLLERDAARRMTADEARRLLVGVAHGDSGEDPVPPQLAFPDVAPEPPQPEWLPDHDDDADPSVPQARYPATPPPRPEYESPETHRPPDSADVDALPASSDHSATENIRLPWAGKRRLPVWRRLGVGLRFGRRAAPLPREAGPITHAQGAPHSFALYSPLQERFRYVHEPLHVDEAAIPLLGHEQLIRALKERLINSRGGTFLITGFRGVGKTTLVERALAEMAAERPRGRRVLPVVLSVARPMQTDKLLFAIVRRVFEELTEAGVLEALPAATRQSLLLAYMRTSLSFKETRSNAWERSSNVELDPAKVATGPLKPVGLAIPKAGVSTRRTRSLATEAAFLAYSETDVEHDMMRIVRMLSAPAGQRLTGWRRLIRWRHRRLFDLQLVVVLDEVDKLTAVQNGLEEVERLLSGIKNVVTMRGAHYLVVAGPDLYDQVLKDSGRGNSIYESVFAWRLYVPCTWAAPARLLESLLLSPAGNQGAGIIDEFEQYLRFKSRGVLRRLLHELNSFVVWEDVDKPFLRIGSQSQATISLYAQIERALDEFFVATRRRVLPTPIDQDRWRLSGYYVVDWILRSEGRPFTTADVIQSVDNNEFDPLLRVTRTGVEMLLEHLARHQVLEVVRPSAQVTSTFIADVTAAQLPSYKLPDALLTRLRGIAEQNEDERAELDYTRAPLAAEISRGYVPIETIGNRYELYRLIGEGGTSSVYEGLDSLQQRPVAVKMLRSALSDDPVARRRFLREARIAEGIHHPNVVDVYEVVTLGPAPEQSDSQFAIVMEFLAAPTLRHILREIGALPAQEVCQAGLTLASALDYLADKGLARLDLKPGNIVMTQDRGPVIIDLGIAKIVKDSHVWLVESDDTLEGTDSVTQRYTMIGTPAYLAPEQLRGAEEIDIRSDIYALGLVLHTCLAGRHPYEGLGMAAIVAGTVRNDVDTSDLPCSPELRQVIARATARDVAQRFQKPTEVLAALRATPEANRGA